MDEVENPEVSPSGQEIAATIEASDPLESGLAAPEDNIVPAEDTVQQLDLENAPVIPPVGENAGPVEPDKIPQDHGPMETRLPQTLPPELSTTAESAAPLPKPRRPLMRRESSTVPPKASPPALPAQVEPQQVPTQTDFSQEHPDSLTLAQLKSLRSAFPDQAQSPNKPELMLLEKVYDFDYRDTQSFPVELEEWFSYSEPERAKLRQIHATFKEAWSKHATTPDGDSVFDFTDSPELGMSFVDQQIEYLKIGTPEQHNEAIQVLCYLALGNWEETAGRLSVVDPFASLLNGQKTKATEGVDQYPGATFQIQWIINTLCLLARQGAVQAVFESLKATCDRDLYVRLSICASRRRELDGNALCEES